MSDPKRDQPDKPEDDEPQEEQVGGWLGRTHRLGTRPLTPLVADTPEEEPTPVPSLRSRFKGLPIPVPAEVSEPAPAGPTTEKTPPVQEKPAPPKETRPAPGSPPPSQPVQQKPAAPPEPAAKAEAPASPAAASPPLAPDREVLLRSPGGREKPTKASADLDTDALTKEEQTDIKSQTSAGKPKPAPGQVTETVWQLIMQPFMSESEPAAVGMEIRGPTVIGRADEQVQPAPDIDLSPYGGAEMGVSRQHAILIPNVEGVWIVDLDSTNGTWINGLYLQPGLKYRLRNGDHVEFGTLMVLVRVFSISGGTTDQKPGRGATVVSRTKPKSS